MRKSPFGAYDDEMMRCSQWNPARLSEGHLVIGDECCECLHAVDLG